MGILSSNKQVIIIGNDGIVHYLSKGNVISQSLTLPWGEPDFVATLKKTIIDAGRNVAVQLVFDVVEQQYRKETIPPVNPFDKSRVVQRKLRMVYPNHDVRAFLPLKQKPKEGKGSVYLFSALPSTREVDMVVEAVLESNVAIDGMILLPMEGTMLTKKMAQLYFKSSKENASKWTVLMGHHKTGGIRQIVIRDGELALTRLTPVGQKYLTDPSHSPVGEMIKEFSSTLTYLARFGYSASDGLDLIVVSGDEAARKFQESNLPVSHLKTLTVGQAISDLKIGRSIGTEIEDQSADILHAAWIAKQFKHIMPLTMKKVDKLQKARFFTRSLVLVSFFSMFGLGAYLASQYSEIKQVKVEIQEQKDRKVHLQKQYDEAAKVFNVLEYDPENIRVILSVYKQLQDKTVDPNPSFLAIHDSLVDSMSLETLGFKTVEPEIESQYDEQGNAPKKQIEITIGIQFPSSRDTVANVRDVEAFEQNLNTAFPNSHVKVVKMPGDLSVDKTVQGVSKNVEEYGLDSGIEQTGDVAEITITGEAL